jgi:hypothetical protein
MFDFLIHVVFKDRLELLVLTGFYTLPIPVNRFQLFHETDESAMDVEGFGREFLVRFMGTCT